MKPATLGAGCLLSGAAGFFALAFFMFLDPSDGKGRLESLVPGLFFGTVVLVPGLALFIWNRNRDRKQVLEERCLGLIRTHDRFTTSELATKLGTDFVVAQGLIQTLAERTELDLVFHRPDQSWIHRKRLQVKHAIFTNCPSCGVAVGSQVVFEDESVACPYCDSPLRTGGKPQ
jgi:hypothetical protein